MNLGELRHPIEVLSFTVVQDPVTGEITEEWIADTQVWGKVEGVSGNAFIAASAEQRETNLRVTLQHQALDPLSNRLRFDGVDHEIEAVLPTNTRELLTVMVSRLA